MKKFVIILAFTMLAAIAVDAETPVKADAKVEKTEIKASANKCQGCKKVCARKCKPDCKTDCSNCTKPCAKKKKNVKPANNAEKHTVKTLDSKTK